jgi:hypothetical protein
MHLLGLSSSFEVHRTKREMSPEMKVIFRMDL